MSTNALLHVEKHLLSLFTCGCYLSTQDIVVLGQELGVELAYKKRSMLLQTLFLHAKETNKNGELVALLCTLLETKAEQLLNLLRHYPKTLPLMQHFMVKINATKLLLQRELALHVKESDGND